MTKKERYISNTDYELLTKLYPYLFCMSIYFYRFSINIYWISLIDYSLKLL